MIFGCAPNSTPIGTNNPRVNFYGSGINSDALANTTIGGPFLNTTAYRFRSNHTGALQAIRVYIIWSTTLPGYHGGTGGSLLFSLQPDDGPPNHHPSGNTIASILYRNPMSNGNFPLLTFSPLPQLQSGRLYHLVITNNDPDPAINYISVNSLWMQRALTPQQPTINDLDWYQLLGNSTRPGEWVPRDNGNNDSFTPILELKYVDGYSTGVGYMEVWVGKPKTISGNAAVRETFTVSGKDRNVSRVSARLKRTGGNGSLTVRLEEADGTLVEEGAIPAFSVSSSSHAWVTYTFRAARSLIVGRRYYLVFTAPANTSYAMFPIRQGGEYSFENTTYFPDGYAQFTTGSEWVGWDQWGVPDRKESDLQFYFTMIP